MKKLLFSLASLVAVGLVLGGCANRRSHAGPGPGQSFASAEYDRESGSHGDRGKPDCGPDGKFSTEHGKCVGNEVHDKELSASDKETFATCNRIVSRKVLEDGKLVHQQKGIGCKRPG